VKIPGGRLFREAEADDVSEGEEVMKEPSGSAVRCGIILAAGEGRRLEPFVRQFHGEALPKQYVNFIGRGSMLEETIARAEKLIPSERLFTVVARHHLEKEGVVRQLSDRPPGTVVIQPENRETAPGLLLPLMHLYKRHPESVVVLFPSDHYIQEEDRFMDYIERACRAVERDPSRVVLLGMEPTEPESEYGYILPDRGAKAFPRPGIRRVSRFIEKPEPRVAARLMREGGLWNTMVTVFTVRTLLGLSRSIVPMLYRAFLKIHDAIGTPAERETVFETYRWLPPVNFSSGLLERIPKSHPSRLWVLPVRGVYWSDCGRETKVLEMLKRKRTRGREWGGVPSREPVRFSGSVWTGPERRAGNPDRAAI
jgi:mannose-1-phosphate guanylyltransferase